MPLQPATCPLDCPDACGVLVETDDEGRFVRVRGRREHPHSRGTLCGKTAQYGDLVTSSDRLLEPFVREGRSLLPATWDAALARIAERVGPLAGREILAAHYAGSMGLVARRFPMRAMHALGADETDGGLCDNTATAGFQVVLGRVLGADLEELPAADFVLVWGCDVARTHQHLQPRLKELCGSGVPVVVIDVWRTDTIRRIESWGGRGLVIRPGTDAALALALARLAFERDWADRAFLERECLGADEFEAHLRAGHDLAWAARTTGLAQRAIEDLGTALAHAQRPFLKTGVGFTRRRQGGGSMRAVCSLAAVLGRADRVHYESFDCFDLATDAIERRDLRPASEERDPVVHVQLGRELLSGRHRALFVWGHNPAVTCPDALAVRAGLEREDLFVCVHEQFLTETAVRADVVLPATTFVEHADVYRSYGHRYLHWTHAAVAPPGQARSNVAAFSAIARVLDLPRDTWDVTEEGLCEELVAASADRFRSDDVAALRAGDPVKMRPPERDGWGTPSGKIELASAACEALGQPRCASWVPDCGAGDEGDATPFVLLPAPSIHTHNSTFAHSPRHLRRVGPPLLALHPDDAAGLGLGAGARARVSNSQGALTLAVALDANLVPGLVRVDGLPRSADVPEGVGINALTSPDVSDLGDGNVLYSTRVRIEPAQH